MSKYVSLFTSKNVSSTCACLNGLQLCASLALDTRQVGRGRGRLSLSQHLVNPF